MLDPIMPIFNPNPVCESDEESLQFIEEMTKNVDAVQEHVLAEILSQNAEAEYLRRYKLGGATDCATFKAKVPVVTYDDLLPDIERIVNGDRSPILASKPISEFFRSSATSGKQKLLPSTKDNLDRGIFFFRLSKSIENMYMPGLDKGKHLNFIILRDEAETRGGITVNVASTIFFKSCLNHFLAGNSYSATAVLCQDYFQSMYVQMLSGLYRRLQILHIGTLFASGLVRSIQFLIKNWPQLAHDIETGTLSEKISNQSLRGDSVLLDLLKPDPELAGFITKHCSNADWSGIINKIWPNVKYLKAIATGTMSQYVPLLEFYGRGLPILSMHYVSSEGFLGINLRPMCHPSEVSYTLMPNMAYFEFIPQESDNASSTGTTKPVNLSNVEVGKEYELVITTHTGLYRYQHEDILQVTGFYNAAPQFKFVRRKKMLLSITGENTDEVDLKNAVDNASKLLKVYGAAVMEYTSYADTKSIPGHYVIYWELMLRDAAEWPDGDVFDGCCLEMEEAMNEMYREMRMTGEVGSLEIRVVKGGTFGELMDYAVSRGASINQYKVPRCVTLPDIIETLNSRVLSTHFSPACPKLNLRKSVELRSDSDGR